jgi:hypothetical protein
LSLLRSIATNRRISEKPLVWGRIGEYCKPCHNRIGRETKQRLYGGTRHYHLLRRYGITGAQADEMIHDQGGRCAICRERPAEHVDHDHVSGAVRGMLCFNCNGGLGQFRDRTELLRAAAEYLEREPVFLPVLGPEQLVLGFPP